MLDSQSLLDTKTLFHADENMWKQFAVNPLQEKVIQQLVNMNNLYWKFKEEFKAKGDVDYVTGATLSAKNLDVIDDAISMLQTLDKENKKAVIALSEKLQAYKTAVKDKLKELDDIQRDAYIYMAINFVVMVVITIITAGIGSAAIAWAEVILEIAFSIVIDDFLANNPNDWARIVRYLIILKDLAMGKGTGANKLKAFKNQLIPLLIEDVAFFTLREATDDPELARILSTAASFVTGKVISKEKMKFQEIADFTFKSGVFQYVGKQLGMNEDEVRVFLTVAALAKFIHAVRDVDSQIDNNTFKRSTKYNFIIQELLKAARYSELLDDKWYQFLNSFVDLYQAGLVLDEKTKKDLAYLKGMPDQQKKFDNMMFTFNTHQIVHLIDIILGDDQDKNLSRMISNLKKGKAIGVSLTVGEVKTLLDGKHRNSIEQTFQMRLMAADVLKRIDKLSKESRKAMDRYIEKMHGKGFKIYFDKDNKPIPFKKLDNKNFPYELFFTDESLFIFSGGIDNFVKGSPKSTGSIPVSSYSKKAKVFEKLKAEGLFDEKGRIQSTQALKDWKRSVFDKLVEQNILDADGIVLDKTKFTLWKKNMGSKGSAIDFDLNIEGVTLSSHEKSKIKQFILNAYVKDYVNISGVKLDLLMIVDRFRDNINIDKLVTGSGFRDPLSNATVGGAPRSAHKDRNGIDIHLPPGDMDYYIQQMRNTDPTVRIFVYTWGLHIDKKSPPLKRYYSGSTSAGIAEKSKKGLIGNSRYYSMFDIDYDAAELNPDDRVNRTETKSQYKQRIQQEQIQRQINQTRELYNDPNLNYTPSSSPEEYILRNLDEQNLHSYSNEFNTYMNTRSSTGNLFTPMSQEPNLTDFEKLFATNRDSVHMSKEVFDPSKFVLDSKALRNCTRAWSSGVNFPGLFEVGLKIKLAEFSLKAGSFSGSGITSWVDMTTFEYKRSISLKVTTQGSDPMGGGYLLVDRKGMLEGIEVEGKLFPGLSDVSHSTSVTKDSVVYSYSPEKNFAYGIGIDQKKPWLISPYLFVSRSSSTKIEELSTYSNLNVSLVETETGKGRLTPLGYGTAAAAVVVISIAAVKVAPLTAVIIAEAEAAAATVGAAALAAFRHALVRYGVTATGGLMMAAARAESVKLATNSLAETFGPEMALSILNHDAYSEVHLYEGFGDLFKKLEFEARLRGY